MQIAAAIGCSKMMDTRLAPKEASVKLRIEATANLKVTFEPSVRNPNYSVPVTFAIRRTDTMAISSVP
jgi:hypothetical protein